MVAHGDVGILRIIYNLELRIVLRISDNCVVKCAFDVDCDTVALLDGVFDRNEDLDDEDKAEMRDRAARNRGDLDSNQYRHLPFLLEYEIVFWMDMGKVQLVSVLSLH